jgi:hypothetical protein
MFYPIEEDYQGLITYQIKLKNQSRYINTKENVIYKDITHISFSRLIDGYVPIFKKPFHLKYRLFNLNSNDPNKINNLSSKNVGNYIYDITKMDIPNSIGYKKDYRIYHLNAFDTEKKNIFSKKKSRKWSDN